MDKMYVDFLAKKLVGNENQEKNLNDILNKLKTRTTDLLKAQHKMMEGFQQVLDGLKMAFPQMDLNDPNFEGTPERMARAYLEICSGMNVDHDKIFSRTFPAEKYNEMVMLRDIEYASLCAHHFFPFTGYTHIGYLPKTENDGNGGRIVGLSKLARVVEAFALKPQLQERMCMEIMRAIKKALNPSGIMVVIEGQHGCLGCRGVRKHEATMVTSALDGVFKSSSKLRSEFLTLLNKKK